MPTTVLLCDTPERLELLCSDLRATGADVEIETASDGFRAVEIAARTHPAVVVVGTALEGMTCVDLVQRMRAAVPDTRIVCRSSDVSPAHVGRTLEAGASAVVLDEDGPEAVAAAIASALGGTVALGPQLAARVGMHLVLETEQRRALEGALADMIVRQDELMSTKAEFLANVSHELRTPVTVAKGIAFVLKHEGIAAEEQHEFLVQLDASLDKLMMLVDEMLTIAELDRGALQLEPTETDLAPLLHREADEIGRRYPAIPIERTIPEDLIASVDPLRFPEIVRQLLDNACRFSAEGSPVLLRARTMSEGIVVSVTDRGSGLERRVALQAFAEPFSAGEEILRKERAGVGIGLYMARQLVLQHGGIMWSDPLPAGGTRFAFCLPERPGETVTRRPRISADGEPDASRSAAGSTYRASTTTSS